MRRPRVLMTGDLQHREFREPVEWLRREVVVDQHPSIATAADWLADGQVAPDWIVVAQSHPGQFADDQVQRLSQAAPLARPVVLLGSWCAGERRTGRPWPGWIRIHWHQWRARFNRESERWRRGLPTWSVPRTATDAERLLFRPLESAGRASGLVAVHAPSFSTFDGLADCCRAVGYCAVWINPAMCHARGVDVVVWDAGRFARVEELAALAAKFHPAPALALVDFHQLLEQPALQAAGASAILCKPFLADDLNWHLRELLARTAINTHAA